MILHRAPRGDGDMPNNDEGWFWLITLVAVPLAIVAIVLGIACIYLAVQI